ncbi:MAG: DUF4349 domain-containing protein [Planctomycetes bacterium]|nr:DUF4349 domain-containing protein [Planctomycetota bacterium]
MDCNEARILIDERVHGSLDGEQSARLDAHLESCADCAQDLKELSRIRALLEDAKELAPPPAALDGIWSNVLSAVREEDSAPTTPRKPPMTPLTAPAFVYPEAAAASRRESRMTWAASGLVAAALILLCFMLGSATGPARYDLTKAERTVSTGLNDAEYGANGNEGGVTWSSRYGYAPATPAAPPAPRSAPASAQELVDKSDALYPPGMGGGNSSSHSSSSGGTSSSGDGSFDGPDDARLPANDPGAPSLHDTALKQQGQLSKEYDQNVLGEKRAGEKKDDSTEAPVSGNGTEETGPTKPKIIKTGELTVEVKDFKDASRKADELIVNSGGFIADSRVFNLEGAAKKAVIKVRVTPEKFEALFVALKQLGIVLHERAGGQDITAQYTDVMARIKNMQIAEERLQELIKTKTFMDKVQSLLEVERELNRVRGEIESMQGQMRVWNDMLGLSTLTLTIQEPTRAVPSGSLAIEVRTLAEAKTRLDEALAGRGGQLLSGQTTKRGDGTLQGDYTLRVEFGQFAGLLDAIKSLGRAQDEQVVNQPFGAQVPEGAERVPCELRLRLFERGVQLPNGSLHLEVDRLDGAVDALKKTLEPHEAAIVTNQTSRQGDGTLTAGIQLRVKAGNFIRLVDALKPLGRITHLSVNGEGGEIRGGAAEVPCTVHVQLAERPKQVPSGAMAVEVEAFPAARDALSALIQKENLQVLGSDSQQQPDGAWAGVFRLGIKADKMDAVVTEFEKLGRVKTRNLQGLGLGDLSRVDPSVLGEVTVTLSERPKLTPHEEGAFRLFMRDTFSGFLASISIIVRGFGFVLPWLLGAALVYLLLRRVGKKPAAAVTPAPMKPEAEETK